MRLGLSYTFPHTTPEEWAQKHADAGLQSVVFPCGPETDVKLIDQYAAAAKAHDLMIAEVGAWSNPMNPDEKVAAAAISGCKRRLELAEYVGARCCVNISGACGPVWDGGYADNYSPKTYEKIVRITQDIIDHVNPKNTVYALEPMPNMLPDSPETYLQLIKDIGRPGFGVHMDAVNMMNTPRRYFASAKFVKHAFSLLKDHIVSCHLKDCILENKLTISIQETECGKGGFDIPAYLACAEETNKDMPVIIEHLDSLEKYMNALNYIKDLCKAN